MPSGAHVAARSDCAAVGGNVGCSVGDVGCGVGDVSISHTHVATLSHGLSFHVPALFHEHELHHSQSYWLVSVVQQSHSSATYNATQSPSPVGSPDAHPSV